MLSITYRTLIPIHIVNRLGKTWKGKYVHPKKSKNPRKIMTIQKYPIIVFKAIKEYVKAINFIEFQPYMHSFYQRNLKIGVNWNWTLWKSLTLSKSEHKTLSGI